MFVIWTDSNTNSLWNESTHTNRLNQINVQLKSKLDDDKINSVSRPRLDVFLVDYDSITLDRCVSESSLTS